MTKGFEWMDYVQVGLAGAGAVAGAMSGNVAATIWAFVAMLASATLAHEKRNRRPATLYVEAPIMKSLKLDTPFGTTINGEWFPPGKHTLWQRD